MLRRRNLVGSGYSMACHTIKGRPTTLTGGNKREPWRRGCGTRSARVHSRYHRRVTDLPIAGRALRRLVVARRFYCDAVMGGRRIFAERFADLLAPRARRTARLDHIVHHLGLALGGRPAASFARRLMLPVGNDTLPRVVRRRGRPRNSPPTIVGIDDCLGQCHAEFMTNLAQPAHRVLKTQSLLMGLQVGSAPEGKTFAAGTFLFSSMSISPERSGNVFVTAFRLSLSTCPIQINGLRPGHSDYLCHPRMSGGHIKPELTG